MITKTKLKALVRRWCRFALTHQDTDDPVCGLMDCGSPVAERQGSHRLQRRRMFVCFACEQGYFNRMQFEQHECFSAY